MGDIEQNKIKNNRRRIISTTTSATSSAPDVSSEKIIVRCDSIESSQVSSDNTSKLLNRFEIDPNVPITKLLLATTHHPPPSFAESEFHQIRKQQMRNKRGGTLLKWSNVPSRYPNLSNSWEFAG
jgi:hypothetical protein